MSASTGYATARWVFFRLLGLAYLFAFASLAVQVVGLIGHDGILPAGPYFDRIRAVAAAEGIGIDRFRLLPTLCWIGAGDTFLRGLCIAGAVLAALLVAGIAPIFVLPALWLLYLSLMVAARDFLSYQWDALLLETGLIAVLMAPLAWRDRFRDRGDPPRLGLWLMWWLLFRLMFGSGAVKLASGDPTWRNLTALAFHYETQPLPTPLAWYAHLLPLWIQKLSTATVLAIELGAPWLMLGRRRARAAACALLAGLQLAIAATGNFAYFNLLSASLCLLLLDDGTWRQVSQRFEIPATAVRPDAPASAVQVAGMALRAAFAIVTVPVSLFVFTGSLGVPMTGAPVVAPLADVIAPLRSVNSYGLFAVMTTTRDEIVVEGSDNGVEWRPYEFAYKPGDPRRAPPFVAPHQPRLDWQMWFAALGPYDASPWFRSFCERLLEGAPDVHRLLAFDPFPDRPPAYVRAERYRYHFADWATRRRDGVWWTRERIGAFGPVLARGGALH